MEDFVDIINGILKHGDSVDAQASGNHSGADVDATGIASQTPVNGGIYMPVPLKSMPRSRTVELRFHSRAMPEQPMEARGFECGPACRWPPRDVSPELATYASDMRGMGIPAEALPPALIPWSVAGWDLRPAGDGGLQMIPGPGCHPVGGENLRGILRDHHVRRRAELALDAWAGLQALLDVADACMDEAPRIGPTGIAFPVVSRKLLSSPEACAGAARTAGWLLAFVPEALKTPALCLEAVQRHGRALAFVPENIRTPEICMDAVSQDGMALEFVPDGLKTPLLCKHAVQQDGRSLKFVPESLRAQDLCAAAVRQNGWAIGDVPKAVLTSELCLVSVRQAPLALRRVPASMQTPDLCLEAVRRNGLALVAVPDATKTEELCLEAIQRAGLALQWVPDSLKSREICLVAVRQNAWAMEHVPGALKTKEFCLNAVQENDGVLDFVPDAVRTAEFCLEAVRLVPTTFTCWRCPKTPEICMAAVKADGRLLRWIPEPLRTPELCTEAVRQNAVATVDVPARMRSSETAKVVFALRSQRLPSTG